MTRKTDPRRAELRRLLKQHPDTAFMEVLIPDVSGVLKGKRVRAKDFEKTCTEPFFFCGGTVLLDILGEVNEGCLLYTSDAADD